MAGVFEIGDTLWFGAAWILVTTVAVLAVPDLHRLRPPDATFADPMTMRP